MTMFFIPSRVEIWGNSAFLIFQDEAQATRCYDAWKPTGCNPVILDYGGRFNAVQLTKEDYKNAVV